MSTSITVKFSFNTIFNELTYVQVTHDFIPLNIWESFNLLNWKALATGCSVLRFFFAYLNDFIKHYNLRYNQIKRSMKLSFLPEWFLNIELKVRPEHHHFLLWFQTSPHKKNANIKRDYFKLQFLYLHCQENVAKLIVILLKESKMAYTIYLMNV